jgi:hypothetical protein
MNCFSIFCFGDINGKAGLTVACYYLIDAISEGSLRGNLDRVLSPTDIFLIGPE